MIVVVYVWQLEEGFIRPRLKSTLWACVGLWHHEWAHPERASIVAYPRVLRPLEAAQEIVKLASHLATAATAPASLGTTIT